MSYVVRDDNGRLILKLTNRQAQMIIDDTRGHFRARLASGTTKTVFHLDKDITVVDIAGLTVYLWKDSILIPGEQ